MNKKKVIQNQQYEDYWKITLEYSDFTGARFNEVLSILVKYIDNLTPTEVTNGFSSVTYQKIQKEIYKIHAKADQASTRKSINQMFKLGFVNNRGRSYHPQTRNFLNEKDKEVKRRIYSQILYENASLNRSFTKDATENEIQFLIKTIDACKTVSKNELLAIMFCKLSNFPRGFIIRDELNSKTIEIEKLNVGKRKFNQRNFLFKICKSLSEVYSSNDTLSLNSKLIVDKQETESKGRDSYLQRLYKIDLINEQKKIYGFITQKCSLENKSYPVLIASHIKPYRLCSNAEKFDKNNGLLLSKNMDSLFDLGYITFDEFGKIMSSSQLDLDIKTYLNGFSLDSRLLSNQRKIYLEFHRKHVYIDNKKNN